MIWHSTEKFLRYNSHTRFFATMRELSVAWLRRHHTKSKAGPKGWACSSINVSCHSIYLLLVFQRCNAGVFSYRPLLSLS